MSTTSCEQCEDFAADARKVLSQRCAPDERHCSCVPHLRVEIERLTAERDAIVADLAAAAGELMVPIPEPGTTACRMMLANVLMRRERDAARAELEEARLTLAAEQGRAEGAPSEGWIPDYQSGQFPCWQWRKTAPSGERVTVDYFPVERRWEWCFMDRPNYENFPWVRDRFRMTVREAMIVVDEAIKRSRRIPDSEVPSGPHK